MYSQEAAFPAVRQLAAPQQQMTVQQAAAGMRAEPVFPSLGSTMGGVTTHSYVVSSEGAQASQGAMAPPLTYISFQHPGAGAGHALGIQDEIRTIFVTGFPDNVHERELHNLCRFIPGYEASQVAFKAGQQPQVFVLFSTPAHARQAMEALAGLPFDVQHPNLAGSRTGLESAATSSTSVSTSLGPSAVTRTNTNGVDERSLSSTANNSQGDAGAAAKAPAGPEAMAAAGGANSAGGAMSRLTNFVHARQAATGTSPVLASSSSSLNNAGGGVVRSMSDVAALGGAPVKYILRCEMAHKNLYVKENDPSVRRPHRQILLHNQPGNPGSVSALNSSGAVSHLALAPNAAAGNAMYLHDLPVYTAPGPASAAGGVSVHPLTANAVGGMSVQHAAVQGASGTPLGGAVPLGTPLGFLPVTNRGDNPPCNTLFIGNLSDQVSELELLHLLSGQPGYKQMKLVRGPRQVSCFVEFEDTATATAVHNTYQGAVLASSDRGGIRIQFSKNPFGKRSSTPGSNMQALRSAVGLQGSGDLQSAVAATGAWPVVTYHTVQQPMPSQGAITYY